MKRVRLLAFIGICLLSRAAAEEQRAGREQAFQFFETKIRPVLVEHCYECHAVGAKIVQGGLLLDHRDGLLQGGDSGAAIVPGQAAESLLMRALHYDELEMPPAGKLPDSVIRDFESWIAMGAPDPRSGSERKPQAVGRALGSASDRHWAYQPLQNPAVPEDLGHGSANPVDRFLNSVLASAGMAISPELVGEPRDLVRRLHFDLTGLPPTHEEVRDTCSAADFDEAWRRIVDRLLAAPTYGEAFARRWMDVARYAESVTLRGMVFSQAWRYRDYLIHAYNEDRPFDAMIREQIAGDLLSAVDRDERWRQLVATTFLAMGNTNFEEQDKQQLDMDYVDEQLDVIGQAFLGQTIGCARCHDHKFDPIPTRDYYALAGIFKSAVAIRHANVSNWIDQPLPLPSDEEQRFTQWEQDLQRVTKELVSRRKLATALARKADSAKAASTSGSATGIAKPPADSPDPDADPAVLAAEVQQLESRQKDLQSRVDQRPRFLTIVEEQPPRDQAILIRGNVHQPGAVVPRGFLSAVCVPNCPDIPAGASGRLQFAEWLSSGGNPLTARVYANRVWCWLMGQGLVDSVNNFGTTGSPPSHPELLDWLAGELIRSGWSTKHLVRQIVLSDAYRRRVVEAGERAAAIDPDNRLYWSGPRRRLSAEELRDAMLQASGELDTAMGGSLIRSGTKADHHYVHASTRRSIYQPVFRNALPELFDTFDFASPSVSTGQRTRSTVATQALTLVNEPWVRQRAQAMAARLVGEHERAEPETLIRAAFRRCLQREPSAEELLISHEFFETQDPAQLARLAHALIASIDFRYLQ